MKKYINVNSIAIIILLICVGAYQYYTWSDCLEDNSVLTCMRMLNK